MTVERTGSRPRWLTAALILAAAAAVALVAWMGLRMVGLGRSEALATRDFAGVRVGVGSRPARPSVGENTLVVRVTDSAGRPLRGAKASANVFMPAMGSMPYMESRPALREARPGVFEGRYALPMGGSWDLSLTVTPPSGRAAHATLRIAVGTGISWASEPEEEQAGEGAPPAGGAIIISAARRQEIGITTATVERRSLDHTRRTVGRVTYDETRRAEVTLKYPGWVRQVRADFTGQPVRRGQVLFTAYSPEIYAAQREFVNALAARDSIPAGPARQRADELARAAGQRLALWDVSPAQLAQLERTRRPQEAVAVTSPVSGVVLEKSIVQGSAFQPGQVLYRIAPVDPVWVIAEAYQYELAYLRPGQRAKVSLPLAPGLARSGRIAFVYPFLEDSTRTGQVRIELANRDLALKPEMYVDVEIAVPLGVQVAVPASAVVYTGERRVVFVDRGGGQLEPRDVLLGPKAGDYYLVRSGLSEGERVVTSGNFLVAAESRLRSATQR